MRAYAQTDTIRYVHPNGVFSNDGRSWATATNKLQDAINELRDYLSRNNLSSGSVYVAAGTYVPTESTESSGGSMLNTSFKIYAGIHVYGGFNPDAPESSPGERKMINGKMCKDNWSDPSGVGTTSGDSIASQWALKYKTILSGNHSTSEVVFTFDSIRGRYNTTYPANSFHVVWFATNGQYSGAGVNDSTAGHFRPLERMASLDGCVITSGNASSRSTTIREHTAYGGGVYMVGNSELRNCTVERCNATLRGGGIYMDGGGVAEFCYVHTCQSNGVGVVQGYGGGVCIEHEGSIGHSHITNCAARCGGGLLICHVPEEFPAVDDISYYSPFATACVINNNTASAEGGGVYLAEGGTINHCTVTGNNCIGPDVTYYGRRHGRTGGIYVRNCGLIFNSVFWGNRCDVNNDVQFASVRQKVNPQHEISAFHSAFMNHDITDWTGVTKEMVFALEKDNMPKQGSYGNYPCFFNPTIDPNKWDSLNTAAGIYGAGVFTRLPNENSLDSIPGPRIWHLTSYSALDQKGVQVTNAVQDVSPWIRHAHTDYGVVSNPFEPASTLGALVRQPDALAYALIPMQGQEGREHPGDLIPTLFIDPNRTGVFNETTGAFERQQTEGNSWTTPIKDMGEALSFFRKYLVDSVPGDHHYMLPAIDENGKPTGEPTRYDYVQILVKEGTLTTAGPGNYLNRIIRTAAVRVESHMRLYGGYPSSLTGTDTSERNPRDNVSNITANITRISGTKGYENNSAHVMAIVNAEHTIIDGFTLSDANTHNVDLTGSVRAGGGILLSNSTASPGRRIHMVGNELRNSVITNCTAPKGAAIYVNGEHLNDSNEICYAELMMMNCVIRNNKADYVTSGSTVTESHGVITANGRAYVHIEHCDIVNNVGYPFKADSKTTDTNEPIYCAHDEHNHQSVYHGYIRVDNSIIFCNGDRNLDDRGELDQVAKVTSVNPDGQEYVFGMYNMFDADLDLHEESYDQPHGFFRSGYNVPITDHFMPDGILSHFTDDISDVPADSIGRNNKCVFTRMDSEDPNYPTFINPSRNVGNSPSGDRPLYGGKVSYTPMTTNPCVNAAYEDDYTHVDNYDRTDNCTRTRGGAPDVGAIENADLPAGGAVLYVTPDGAGKRDGSSWSNAIAGNTVYVLNNIDGPALADGDRIDSEITCDRVLDSEGNPILTTNEKYNGGWGRVRMNTHTIYSTTHDATVHDHITYKSIYYGGAGDGEGREVLDSLRESREVLPDGEGIISTPEGFVPGTYDDPRYPYGEISGASRSFWRANPYTAGSYGNVNTFTSACNTNGWINNTRAERYVGGLQYAVEKASAANKTYHVDSVQVWVGAGTYNDYKGFVMRDSVTVLGGFPASKYAAPGMAERQALMDTVLNIPKSKPAEKLDAADYETILQISEVNPKRDNTHLETNAVKYWDDDIDFVEHTTITGEVEADRVVTRVKTWQTSDSEEDVTATYYQNSTFHDTDTTNNQTVGNLHSFDFGTPTPEKDCWHLSYTGNSSGPNMSPMGVIGLYEANQMCTPNNSKQDIYENGQIVGKTTANCLGVRNGTLSGVKVWQTMKDVPAGEYKIVVDMNAYYRTGTNRNINANNIPTGVNFIVIASNGDTLLNAPINAKNKVGDRLQNNLARWQLNRYTFDHLIQPTTGSLKISIEVGALDGSKGNNREALMENFHLIHVMPGNAYSQTDYSDVRTQHPGSTGSSTSTYSSTATTHRTTLRKRVLTMPDVCVPTYGGGGIGDPVTMAQAFTNDALPHTDRVKGPTKAQRTAATLAKQEDSHYVEYNEATWDGFTIRHGFLYDEAMAHGGGAGVNMYEGAHLRNCIVIHNVSACQRVKGAGMFCDGATSTIEGCFVLNNTSTRGTASSPMDGQIFAGGMFMYEGTCFNSLFANNYSHGSAGGLGFCVGRFYNNTIAYNTANLVESGSSNIQGGAVSLATSSNPNLFVANTIIFGNNGIAIRDRNTAVANVNPFLFCYIQSAATQPYNATKQNVTNWTESVTTNYGTGNTFLNGVAPSAANTPFAADFDESGNYVAGRAASLNDFRLRDGIGCVNHGTEEFAGEFYTALRHKGKSDSEIRNLFIYQSVEAAQLPDNDVAFAKRVQDCQIDMGAYEYNAAYNIKPDTTTHPGKAIFYISYDSPGGDASGSAPENAACAQKLQLVLDAAGRYKYNLMRVSLRNPSPVAGQPDSTWTVEVWMEGDDKNATTNGEYGQWYTPTRSTKHSVLNYHDNTLDYSFIIPRGIYVKGGYKPGFYHEESGVIVDDRDPLTYRSVLSGKITSSTGAEGQTYHVVTFTKDLFDLNEKVVNEGNQLDSICPAKDAEVHRAVIDGLFIEDGYANAPDENDCIGGGAVVTDFAHVRNCVVQNNEASENGGGLYLKPNALVSGTIIKKNIAGTGGGMYIESPNQVDSRVAPKTDSLAHVFATTICHNSATQSAGGMWFQNTDARVNSTVLWQNTANDNANVAGNFTRTGDDTEYPFAFCAVESRRLEGQGNIELSPKNEEGVRWDEQDPFNAILYYPIEMSSTLAHSGMSYIEWDRTLNRYATMDTTDIAGVSRKRWITTGKPRGFAWGSDVLVTKNNDCVEIGARALNKTFEINVDTQYVMRRLYVMTSELIDSKAARALQDNISTDSVSNMYRQMGSSILNPFHRLGDAFDYIIAARKSNPAKYRNAVFEVYIEGGTYYPYHNAYGEQDEVRNNTFLVPEAIYVIGGIDSKQDDHKYGQDGYRDDFTGDTIGQASGTLPIPGTGYSINVESRDNIRKRDDRHRPMRDNNLNSVIEPWELERQTILSGNAVAGEDFTHVYHVITMHADSTKVGPQPRKYKAPNPAYKKDTVGVPMFLLKDTLPMNDPSRFHEECDQSILGRTTEFDGIQITGGYANHLDAGDTARHHYTTKTYFRGGGIFVDGNWTKSFDDPNSDVPNVTEPAKYNIPIVVENCQFSNNMAANGGGLFSNGGIYMYGCHFTQNYSQGPMTRLDQRFIPWSAGGCIATTATCDISNSLFDNNEARRGLYPITISGEEYIPDADARQGFGGVLSVAAQSRMRVVNCHFMKNKAVAYSAIYNFLANNHYSDPDSMQIAFNTIFWGNEVFEVDNIGELEHKEAPSPGSIEAFNTKYKASRAGVFHYDGELWDRYEKLFHEYDSLYNYWTSPDREADLDTFHVDVINKLRELRQVGDSMEGLYFCSYRKGYGPTGMKPTKEGYLMTKKEQRAYKDSRQTPVRLKVNDNGDTVERSDSLFSYLHGNNNVLINRLNNAPDGPNFKQPSFVAGIDGYMQNADWLLARMNLTTDQGWGHLSQTVARGISYYITKYTGQTQYPDPTTALNAAQDSVDARGMSITVTQQDVYPISGLPVAEFNAVQSPLQGIYNWYAYRYGYYMSDVNAPLPLGDQYYMHYTRSTTDSEMSGNMYRISKNPKMGEKDVYIDIGMYEYQYVQLDIKGQEIDTVWVATEVKGVNQSGLSWKAPTTDLQYAIDLLMSSHNNHDKYVCFLGGGDDVFIPNQVLDNRRAFVVSSNTLQPILPDSAMADFDYAVRSLNFLGGYSFDVEDAPRDPLANPTVIEMPNIGTASQRNQLFIVEDMTRQLTQANWQGEYMTRDSVVIPITFDGITFINPYSTKDPSSESYTSLGGVLTGQGGAAIYYRWQRIYEDQGGVSSPNFNMALHPDSALIDGRKTTLPKLTISNCTFMDNGALTASVAERSPAVFIGYGGGGSLIVNSLFHSNAGAPIFSRNSDPAVEGENNFSQIHNPAVIVNSTFALNGGHLRLGCDESEVHNSLIWQDDLASDTTTQLQIGTTGETDYWIWDKNTNKDRPGLKDQMTNNAVWGCFVSGPDTLNNENLASDNGDIIVGPNFMNPIDTATTSANRRMRDFRLNPGLKTMNTADTALYRSKVFFHEYPDETIAAENRYWRRPNGFKSALIYSLANDSDLAAKPRLSGLGMERGAYECQAVLQRILYVQPNLPLGMTGDGSSWNSPLGQGQLQNAIDAAAVYTYLNRTASPETQRAYVFVKGSYESDPEPFIRARDGVSVYGSLPSSFNDTAWVNPDSVSTTAYTNGECHRFVNYVRSYVSGVASPNASPTRIGSVRAGEGTFNLGFLLDGFVITNPDSVFPTAPVVLNSEHTAMRNCIITGMNVEDGAPVVDLQKGLLYNTLLYNDSAQVLVRVGADGAVLNNTIMAGKDGVAPIDSTEAVAGAIRNNIIDNNSCFAPYLTSKTPYTLPSHLIQNAALAYQLHERSSQINAGSNTLPAVFNPYIADSLICFWRDRDILGNPRTIGGIVDNGAFETWRIEPNTDVELTSLTNEIILETEIMIRPYTELKASFKNNFGGNAYPHPGSVVYLMDSSSVSMQYQLPNDFEDYSGNDIYFRPGYMLFKPGASFFGNGYEVQLSYVAAEKRFTDQRYSMTAFPFDYYTNNITVTSYDAATDSLNSQLSTFNFNTYQYSGAARSEKDYAFQTNNSSLWLPVDTAHRVATEGYLMDFGSTIDTVLRFTAFAPASQYVYTEDSDDKLIYLTQYDNRVAGQGQELNFTRQEDMGWNMKGLPWLVSNYRTDTVLAEGNFLRQMYIPHVLYQMDGAGDYIHPGDQMYTARSWDRGTNMSMGKAFFTQTATTKDRETVVFHLPFYDRNARAGRPLLRLSALALGGAGMPAKNKSQITNHQSPISSDILTVIPDSTASKTVKYSYGRDGIKWIANDNAAQIYMLDSKRLSRISLLGSAPTEVDIPLGVKIPTTDDQSPMTYIFDLPEKSAFVDYPYVWLIDRKLNRTVNLMEQNYETEIAGGENNERFALRIGGFPLTDAKGKRRYIVYTYSRTLFIRGLVKGDKIDIYTPSGQHVYTTKATAPEWQLPLSYQSGYIVKVNDTPHKVLNL